MSDVFEEGHVPTYGGTMEISDPYARDHDELVAKLTAEYLKNQGYTLADSLPGAGRCCHMAFDEDGTPTLVSVVEDGTAEEVMYGSRADIMATAVEHLAETYGQDLESFVEDVALNVRLDAVRFWLDEDTHNAKVRHIINASTPALDLARDSMEPSRAHGAAVMVRLATDAARRQGPTR